jgi:hypothetical protein
MSNASSTATAVACSASAACSAAAACSATAAATAVATAASAAVANAATSAATTYTLVGDVTYRFYFSAELPPRTLKVFKGELPLL